MTEKQQKQEVSIGGEKVEVITRDEAERAIHRSDPRMVVAYAFEAAICTDGGAAFLDLQTGNIASHSFNDGLPPDEAAYAVLWEEDNSVYESFLDDAYESPGGLAGVALNEQEIAELLGRVRARMQAEGRDEREIAEVDAESLAQEDIDDFLMETHNEGFRDRLGQAYAHELFNSLELPDTHDFWLFARAQLNAIYK